MRRPRLNALRTFEAAGRHLSFSRAAEELHITQAAVSQQIRHLEADLGSKLFHRHHRRISLTETARTYLPVVQEALGQLDQATERHFGAMRNRNVTIRCTSSIATQWLAPHVGEFQTAHPGITLHFRTLEATGGDDPREPVDIEIFCTRERPLGPAVTRLFNAVIVPVAAPALMRRALSDPADIHGFNLIHVVGYDDDWHRWYATYLPAGATAPDGLSVDSSLFAVDAALRGDGVHLGRRPSIDSHLRAGTLVKVFEQPLNLETTYFMRQNLSARGTAQVRDVTNWIRALAGTFHQPN